MVEMEKHFKKIFRLQRYMLALGLLTAGVAIASLLKLINSLLSLTLEVLLMGMALFLTTLYIKAQQQIISGFADLLNTCEKLIEKKRE